ncbi:hypothetical protein BKA56DRAFT_608820 [Ilyonectria sp. MPI-CAGE-AT-0026]|nr:hypothetical protein BKA56DRAFT_608820 [Ilyonectria sp. MPI-CAGE-AT-0026]
MVQRTLYSASLSVAVGKSLSEAVNPISASRDPCQARIQHPLLQVPKYDAAPPGHAQDSWHAWIRARGPVIRSQKFRRPTQAGRTLSTCDKARAKAPDKEGRPAFSIGMWHISAGLFGATCLHRVLF